MPNSGAQSATDFFAECKFNTPEIIEMFKVKLIDRDEARRFLGLSYNKATLDENQAKKKND